MRVASKLLSVVLVLGAGQALGAAGPSFTTLSAGASDPDGDPLTYRWEVLEYNSQPYDPAVHPAVTVDGVYPDVAKTVAGRTAGFTVAGSYRFKVTVSDGQASVSDASLVVRVLPPRPVPGDFNADKKADLLFRHPSSGEVYLWLMS